jgi:hypothetical protein
MFFCRLRFLVGDFCFIAGIMGHCSIFNTLYPSPFCQAKKTDFVSRPKCALRNKKDVLSYAAFFDVQHDVNMSATAKRKLYEDCMGIVGAPLVDIKFENVVPCSLHIIQGAYKRKHYKWIKFRNF